MLFLLTNWKCLLKIGAAAIVTILFTYACHLSHKVDALASENQELNDQVSYTSGYLKKYEAIKQENDALSNQIMIQMNQVKDDEKCPAPKPLRDAIGRLHP